MKNIFYLGMVLLILSSCQKEKKIGYIDNGIVINDYQEKKDLEAKFQLKEEAFRKKFDSIDIAFQAEVQKFQAEANKMSQTKAQERYQQLGQLKQSQDQQRQIEAQQFQKAFQTELDSIISKVKRFENEYGKTNGYSFIIGTSDAASTVLYGSEENDLTQIILDSLNAKYKK
ncbi:OmpH family outer membrane protein [Sabulilitoribacter multivorans]|uniref:OmpH family outer membrane protein n=1 Tax=Flaviramulus multivorans TaxID=1304750 RepID=A0ABS9IFM7_9FLAO|nr:OmpH family outer membrane protein [Flaviramulus multivorans]MCF7559579.1 OmpH family outer membrane protein [Flaviramulus multivorans]